jgi:GNAT superfamily N-acetyltransferase
MQVKLITHKELNKLLKLKVNKNFKENFQLFKPRIMHREITFAAIENNEILGAVSYSDFMKLGKVEIGGQEYILNKNITLLQFIEVKPSARKKGVAKELLTYIFEMCHDTNSGIQISNVIGEGSHLINTYKELSNNYQVDLFFSPQNNIEPQIFNAIPVKKPNVFKKIFGF